MGNAVVEGGETRWQSKKEAREELAGRGTEVVKGMTAVQAGESSTGENWVGKLLGRFDCFLTPPSRPSHHTTPTIESHLS